MSEDGRALVRELLRQYAPHFPLRHSGRLIEDTSEFMEIGYGDVMALAGKHYLVIRDEAERRFGMEDPKFWVKRCTELETGERKIIKLVFYETFPLKIGTFELHCHRSPDKEARILNLVRDDLRFMQGETVRDSKNNNVRILDVVHGKRLDTVVEDIDAAHEHYFHDFFPEILANYIGACESIAFLHAHGEKHGDIRRDHLWVEHRTGAYRWIDFDYAFDFHENPFGLDIFGLGNILLFLTGKGEHTTHSLERSRSEDPSFPALTPDDFSLMFPHRLSNLQKLFPYIPTDLNNVLLHFSAGSYVFYDTVGELLDELRPCLAALR